MNISMAHVCNPSFCWSSLAFRRFWVREPRRSEYIVSEWGYLYHRTQSHITGRHFVDAHDQRTRETRLTRLTHDMHTVHARYHRNWGQQRRKQEAARLVETLAPGSVGESTQNNYVAEWNTWGRAKTEWNPWGKAKTAQGRGPW